MGKAIVFFKDGELNRWIAEADFKDIPSTSNMETLSPAIDEMLKNASEFSCTCTFNDNSYELKQYYRRGNRVYLKDDFGNKFILELG